jgi:hypothetical protein
VDEEGTLHQPGMMRLATAADEILPLKDPRVIKNPAYFVIILLSRVVTKLGSLQTINPKVIEGLFSEDLKFLEDFYNKINGYVMNNEPVNSEIENKEQLVGGSVATL